MLESLPIYMIARAQIVRFAPLLSPLLACADRSRETGSSTPEWKVESSPILTIDGEDSATVLGNIVGATRTPDGGVVVADQMTSNLRYFDSGGKLRRTSGRKGDGPGEFRYLARMLRCGDSLFVYDIDHANYLVFSIGGTYARSFNFAPPDPGQTPYHIACNSDGLFISNGWETEPQIKPGRYRTSVPYWLAKSDGSVTTRLGLHPGSERWAFIHKDGGGSTTSLPLGKESMIAIGRDRVYMGFADNFSIQVVGLMGEALGTIGDGAPPSVTTPADLARLIMLDTIGKTPRAQKSAMDFIAAVEVPKTLPPYTAFIVDSDDNLWVRRFSGASDSVAKWVVFSPGGKEISSVETPLTLHVNEIGKDYVLGTDTYTQSGAPQVKIFRLHRGQTRSN
jgi:hypothetical protein